MQKAMLPSTNVRGAGREPDQSAKTPLKRFVGQRTTNERDTSREETGHDNSVQSFGNTQVASSASSIRVLPRIPREILENPDLQAAVANLPSNYNFEIPKTIHRIHKTGAKHIALQFPEGLLFVAPIISDILVNFCPGIDTLVMGDVTYGACCVDDFTARALGCDLLIHYGHSCLIPVHQMRGIQTLYIFVTIAIDSEHLLLSMQANFPVGKKIALVGTIQFNSALHAIATRLRAIGYDILLPRSSPLSAGEILGCTAPSLAASGSPNAVGPARLFADLILYVGDGRFHLESIIIASPSLRSQTYRYDPYTRRLTHETYQHNEMHSLRGQAIETARQSLVGVPSAQELSHRVTWGIILGTLGRQGNLHTLSLISAHLELLGISHITLLLSEIHPTKLSLLSRDVDVWVQIACPRLSIDWGYAFERPLLSPYEAMVTLGVAGPDDWLEPKSEPHVTQGTEMLATRTATETSSRKDNLGIYPMDFYSATGLGRTSAENIPKVTLRTARTGILDT